MNAPTFDALDEVLARGRANDVQVPLELQSLPGGLLLLRARRVDLNRRGGPDPRGARGLHLNDLTRVGQLLLPQWHAAGTH